ncbi:diacylglycerol kinase family protein [Phycicoccus sp.]|uniref:diacylglycerol/lipid kinase family protein n=1 Tax=Phycicoccus sp. TaxID=1902410 RepID=UPI002C4F3889|nr:diacylglycerol kinase family protein [Phycicoccus sp.]HMM94254.1 diacylglycerol kinase family protein [Phycicoccus sp.]
MSGEQWTWVGIGVAVLFALVGAFLVLSAREPGRHAATSRPSRDTFRRPDDEPPPRKRVAVVVNPTKFDDLDGVKATLAKVCAANDWAEPEVHETTPHDVGFGQTRAALADGVDLVCALGGDGTVRAVAQEMVGSGVPLGLLPGGTGNLLARNLEMPVDDLERAMTVALTGRNRHVDAAWLTLDPEHLELEEGAGEGSSAGERRHAFFVMAGLGLDAAIMDSTSEQLKSRIGWGAYVPAGLRHMLTERFKVTLTTDGGPPESQRARMVVIGNCGKITGGIDLLPDAEPDDGTLDVIVLAPRGVAAWASVAARVITRSDRTSATLSRYRCQTATVEVDEPQRVQVDGDIIGEASRVAVEVQERVLVVRTESRRTAV